MNDAKQFAAFAAQMMRVREPHKRLAVLTTANVPALTELAYTDIVLRGVAMASQMGWTAVLLGNSRQFLYKLGFELPGDKERADQLARFREAQRAAGSPSYFNYTDPKSGEVKRAIVMGETLGAEFMDKLRIRIASSGFTCGYYEEDRETPNSGALVVEWDEHIVREAHQS